MVQGASITAHQIKLSLHERAYSNSRGKKNRLRG
jgi:hypothetical protein